MDVNEAFILGSGSSLLGLTRREREFLNTHPNTLAMNKYLLFYEKVGVIPKNLFLADRHFPAHRVFFESVRRAKSLSESIRYYVNEYYGRLFRWAPNQLSWNLKERLRILYKHQFWIPSHLKYHDMCYFRSGLTNDSPFFWADTLEDELYFYRGSLTTAINLASIIFSDCDIYLVGVDLNDDKAFFADEIEKRPDLLDKYHDIGKKKERHPTAVTIRGYPGVQSVLPQIVRQLDKRDRGLFCCSPNSLLVKEKICEYAPVISEQHSESGVPDR